jgi:hypothetical protein
VQNVHDLARPIRIPILADISPAMRGFFQGIELVDVYAALRPPSVFGAR